MTSSKPPDEGSGLDALVEAAQNDSNPPPTRSVGGDGGNLELWEDAWIPPRNVQSGPCPACASRNVVPIIHGKPTPQAEAAARLGWATLGGCMVWPEKPIWHCHACKHEFGMMKELEDQ